jgi:hypothetical protein
MVLIETGEYRLMSRYVDEGCPFCPIVPNCVVRITSIGGDLWISCLLRDRQTDRVYRS